MNSSVGNGEHPGVLYFYSESIGLAANALCSLLAASSNFASRAVVNENSFAVGIWFITVGGLLQILSALVTYRAHNHFGGTVFAFFSAFWALLGLERILEPTASIQWLHPALLLVNLLFVTVASIVNSFYTLALAFISLASALEMTKRILGSLDNNMNAYSVVTFSAGVAEIGIVLLSSYGVAAAVLHGIYQRQILSGFDHAIVETALWKRKPIQSAYTDGKWGQPKPFHLICVSMCTFALGIWIYDTNVIGHDIVHANGMACWFAVFAIGLWLVSLLHCLRSDQLLSIASLCDACFYATFAFDLTFYGITNDQDSVYAPKGAVLLLFTFVHLLLLFFTILENSVIMDMTINILMFISLFLGSIRLLSEASTKSLDIALVIIFCLTCLLTLYSSVAEFVNAIA